VLAFLSEHSTRDPGVCRDEIAIALGAGKAYVFTILVQPEVDISLPISVSHLQWLDMHDWQARQQADPNAFEAWYVERFTQICAVIDHPDNQRFAGEISQLEEYLLPLDCTPDINSRLPGFTGREWLLDEINTWREGDRSSRIFCLSGGPGMGKSAVVAWLAHSNKAQVIAAQFCRYNSPERRDPTRVIRSIAFQLATRLPDYRRHLLNQPEIKDLDRKNPVDLFDYLLANPLRYAINGNRPRQLIVIDALDETLQNGQSELTELIASQLSKLPDWLGWVVTSRPESAIRGQLEQFGLHEINADDPRNQEDVETYIQHWLPTLGLADAELIHAQQQILTAAQGNFLYVRQLQAAIQQNIIDIKQLNDLPKGLSALYLREFKYRYPDTHHYEQELLPLLEILVASSRPIPTSDIETLLNYTKRQRAKVIERLGSYLTVTEQGVALFHKSLQDWLLDENSAGADYFVEVEKGHQVLGEVLWEQFTQAEDLVSCLDSFMALELPEQLSHWSDEALLRLINQDLVEQYSKSIESVCRLEVKPSFNFIQHEQKTIDWGWLTIRMHEVCFGQEHEKTVTKLMSLSGLFYEAFRFKVAEDFLRKALLISEKVNGAYHRRTAVILCNLAKTIRLRKGALSADEDDINEALPVLQRGFDILNLLEDKCELEIGNCLCDLGDLFEYKFDYLSAEHSYRSALLIYENKFGIFHSETLGLLQCLARILTKLGDIGEAESLLKRELVITESMSGSVHRKSNICLGKLANILHVKGDYVAADIYYRRALFFTERELGAKHYFVGQILGNLGLLLTDKGQYDEAEVLYKRAYFLLSKDYKYIIDFALMLKSNTKLDITSIKYKRLTILGPINQSIDKNLSNAAFILQANGDYNEAEIIFNYILSMPSIDQLTAYRNLARLFQIKGEYEVSEKLFRQSLSSGLSFFVTDINKIDDTLTCLANLLYDKASYEDAELIYSQTLQHTKPDYYTGNRLNGLANIHYAKGNYELAEPLYRRALEITERTMGYFHYYSGINLKNLAGLLYAKGELESAIFYYRQALYIYTKKFGKNHPEIELITDQIYLVHESHSLIISGEII